MDQTSVGTARCRRSHRRAPSSTRGTVSTPVPAGGPGPGTQGSGHRGAEAPSTETLCQRTLHCPGPGRCPRQGWGSTPRPHGNGSVKRTPQDPPEKEVRATPSPRRPALGTLRSAFLRLMRWRRPDQDTHEPAWAARAPSPAPAGAECGRGPACRLAARLWDTQVRPRGRSSPNHRSATGSFQTHRSLSSPLLCDGRTPSRVHTAGGSAETRSTPSSPSESSRCVWAHSAGPDASPQTQTLCHRTHFPRGPSGRSGGS